MTLWQRVGAVVVLGGLAYFFWTLQDAERGSWLHSLGVVVGSILMVAMGACFLPYAARTMASEETIECPGCEGTGQTSEGHYMMINGQQVLSYRCGGCQGEGYCSNGQFTAGAGCGCICLAFIGIGLSAGYTAIFGESPANPPGKDSPAKVEPKQKGEKSTAKQGKESEKPMTPDKPEEKVSRIRTWKSVSGQFTVEAEFQSMTAGTVKLKRVDDGQEITVPMEKLSPEDQKWIRDFRPSR